MAHFSGLVAAGVYPNPCEYADIVTSTTHKTLRGPRSGMILCRASNSAPRSTKLVFPGHPGRSAGARHRGQGGLLPRSHDAGVRGLSEAGGRRMRRLLGETLQAEGFRIVSGGTDSHLILVDVFAKGVRGKGGREGARSRRTSR